jgi:hypothetical protein
MSACHEMPQGGVTDKCQRDGAQGLDEPAGRKESGERPQYCCNKKQYCVNFS